MKHAQEIEFSVDIRHAIDTYPTLCVSRAFDQRFWRALDQKRARNRTWRGQFERFCETEIGGVAVWRVVGSSLAGSAIPALGVALALCAPSPSKAQRDLAPLVLTPFVVRQFWLEESWKTPSKTTSVALLLDPNFGFGAPGKS